ncbi:MAG: hypothetical protein AAF289_07820 [Cyanobacteria bacterium P01_A01_bin.135]
MTRILNLSKILAIATAFAQGGYRGRRNSVTSVPLSGCPAIAFEKL